MSILSVLKLIAERGSIRRYKDTPIPENDLLNIIEAARLAQSAANRQPWQFIVVTDKEIRERLADAAHWQDRPRQSSVETAGAIKAGPVFDLSDGIADDLARISDTIAADGLRSLGGGRLPWNYVITTLGAAVAAAYGLGLVLKAAGLKGPIPMAAAGVAAPLVIEVIQKRRRSE